MEKEIEHGRQEVPGVAIMQDIGEMLGWSKERIEKTMKDITPTLPSDAKDVTEGVRTKIQVNYENAQM